MKIKTKTLVDILEMSSQFLLKTSINKLFAATYVKKEEGSLVFKSYNWSNCIKIKYPLAEEFTTSYIPTFDILKILKPLKSEEIEMWIEGWNIHFKSGKDRFKLKLMDSDIVFPDPEPYGDLVKTVFKQKVFEQIVNVVGPFIPFKNISAGLTWMKVDIKDWKISIAGSDSNKFIVYTDSYMWNNISVLVSKDILVPLAKINALGDIEMEITENYISSFAKLEEFDVRVDCCTMGYPFPDYQTLMKTIDWLEFEELRFNTKDLQDAVSRVLPLTDDTLYGVIFDFYTGKNECAVRNAIEDKGKYQITLNILSEIKKDFNMWVSAKYLLDIIKPFSSEEEVVIKYNDSWLYILIDGWNKRAMLKWIKF